MKLRFDGERRAVVVSNIAHVVPTVNQSPLVTRH